MTALAPLESRHPHLGQCLCVCVCGFTGDAVLKRKTCMGLRAACIEKGEGAPADEPPYLTCVWFHHFFTRSPG